ncbi:MAG: ribbon-helix-helix protein, CopG family [Deltaproteobacteria bacterium]|nr:ribbon-helix-helix protein, CopG family [Deltaproteobacteria bacterium]MBN2686980.1 ribbon-helix-helix protein, CopG family [Deltaproteobacteria bacterium]
MVRPKKDEAKKQYTVMLEPSTVEEIDKLAEKIGITRSQLMRNLIITGIEDTKMLDKLGIIGTVKIARDLYEKIVIGISKGKIRLDDKGELEVKK